MNKELRKSPQRPFSPSPARSPSPKILYEYRKCKICGRDAKQQCCGCKDIYYCSASCHISDWHEHRLTCRLMIPSNRYFK